MSFFFNTGKKCNLITLLYPYTSNYNICLPFIKRINVGTMKEISLFLFTKDTNQVLVGRNIPIQGMSNVCKCCKLVANRELAKSHFRLQLKGGPFLALCGRNILSNNKGQINFFFFMSDNIKLFVPHFSHEFNQKHTKSFYALSCCLHYFSKIYNLLFLVLIHSVVKLLPMD